MSRAPDWTPAEEALLLQMWQAGATNDALSAALPGRGPLACQSKAYSLGMTSHPARRKALYGTENAYAEWSYTQEGVMDFARRWHGTDSITEIATHYGRPESAIKNHSIRLGLGPRRNPHPEYESIHWHAPAKPRLRLCYLCESRLPQSAFDTPNDRKCRECANPGARVVHDFPAVRDSWDEDVPLGACR